MTTDTRSSGDRKSDRGQFWDMMIVFGIMVGIAGTFGLLKIWDDHEARAACGAKADAMGVTWSYGAQGCMVTVDGRTTVVKTQ